MFYIDPFYLYLVVPALLIAMWAQFKVSSTFKKYSAVKSERGYTAAMITRQILDENGLNNISIEHVAGNLTDHYDPNGKVIRLSDSVYNSTSVAAIGVAAHEAGHAVQYAKGYFPIKIRAAMIPVTKIGSSLAIPLAVIGIIMGSELLSGIGIILFMAVVLFQLVTLPVEFNASGRAIAAIEEKMILSDEEQKGAKKVLTAAALTYVAALIVAIANLLRLVLLRNRNER